MPKDTSHSLPPRPHKDLNAVRRDPRVNRALPQTVFDVLAARRNTGNPYRYTTADVAAIASFVSSPIVVDPRSHNWPTEDQFACHRAKAGRFVERTRAEKAKSLAERLEQPSLLERIERKRLIDRIAAAPPTAAPIAPKPVLIDFKKQTTSDLVAIFTPRRNSIALRLSAITEVHDHTSVTLDSGNWADTQRLIDQIDKLDLNTRADTITTEQWKALEFGFKAIGQVSFKGLRSNFPKTVASLAGIYRSNYFDWI